MLVHFEEDLTPIGYTDSDFQSDKDFKKSTFTLGGGVMVWRNVKQSYTTDPTIEAGYVVTCKAAKRRSGSVISLWIYKWFLKHKNQYTIL